MQRALVQAGGVRTGGPPKVDASSGATLHDRVYGYMNMDAWDLLWTVSAKVDGRFGVWVWIWRSQLGLCSICMCRQSSPCTWYIMIM